jgi:hypothetical protein
MGKSFKLQNQSKKIVKEKIEEKKVVYDHRPQIKTNPKILEEFKKNMSVPSKLWDGLVDGETKN